MSFEAQEMGDTAQAQAADWMMLKRSGEMSAREAGEFAAWLEADPAHRAAFDALQAIWDEAGEVREDPTILALRELNLKTFNRPARVRLWGGALAASLALAVVGGWAVLDGRLAGVAGDDRPVAAAGEQVLSTGAGQTTTVTLKDGSTVTLDADTILRVNHTKHSRTAYLECGGAYFQVAKTASAPFIVAAAGKTITANGTAFEARITADQLDVTLIEGKVKVEAERGQSWQGQQSMDIAAGWRLTAAEGRRWSLRQVDVGKEMSWLSGRLTFFNDPLSEAAAKVNRYSDKKIIVDPAIGQAPIVGVFETGDADTFVRGMKLAGIARVGRVTDTSVELVSP